MVGVSRDSVALSPTHCELCHSCPSESQIPGALSLPRLLTLHRPAGASLSLSPPSLTQPPSFFLPFFCPAMLLFSITSCFLFLPASHCSFQFSPVFVLSLISFSIPFLLSLMPLLIHPPPPFHCKLTTNPSFSHYLSPHLPLSSLFLILLCFPFFPFSKLQILFSFCLLLLLHFDLRCQAPFLPSHPILSYPILSCLS